MLFLENNLPEKVRPKKKKYLIYQNSKFYVIWNLLILVLFLYVGIFIPYKLAFMSKTTVIFHDVFEIVINVIFFFGGRLTADMVISCFTAYHRNGRIVESHKEIFFNYIKGWFIIDLISIFPLDQILKERSFSEVAKLSRIFKLFKMLRWDLNWQNRQNRRPDSEIPDFEKVRVPELVLELEINPAAFILPDHAPLLAHLRVPLLLHHSHRKHHQQLAHRQRRVHRQEQPLLGYQ